MELPSLIEALSGPGAYPYPVASVEVRQTHISAVFLAGEFVYKVKKPVDLGFLDFTTLARRRQACDEEVRLNRRLAPGVYLGVVPVARAAAGVRVEGEGEPVEWAVKMRRLPDDASLAARLARGEVGTPLLEALACRVASFHQAARADDHVASFGRFEPVARAVRDVLAQVGPLRGVTVHPDVLARVAALTEEALARLRPLIEARAARGVPREGHGDLRLEHVYCFPDRAPPDDLVVIDGVEFSERLRCLDPVADIAFLAMELALHGRRDLAGAFSRAYLRATGDAEGEGLLPLYSAYRSAVRGAVRGLQGKDEGLPTEARERAREKARAHWLLALGELEPPGRRPCLLLVGGLPGTGKSTLAASLADRAGFEVIRSDAVRKELAGPGAANLYTPGWDDRTYAECLRRAERLLFEGGRVLIDATWREQRRRRAFLGAAARWGVPGVLLVCQATPETVRRRLAARRGDVSDADWAVYQELAKGWEEVEGLSPGHVHTVPSDGGPGQVADHAARALRELGLLG